MRTAVLIAAVAALAMPGAALASRADTFSGSCSGLEGWATWPEQPMRIVPVDMLLRARLSGGECTGTLNGRDVAAVPATARADLRGPQSCGGGILSGRFTFRLAGRTIAGEMIYRRVGSRIAALWQGDGDGSAVVLVHAQVGAVSEDHPLAGIPVVGPRIAGPVTTDETLRRCAAEGLSRMPIFADRITTAPSLSG